MKINIVMLARNRNRLTEQAIRTLYANTPHDLFNLTLIDDDSDDPQVYLTKNTAYLRIEESKGITGQARNLGIYWAEKYWGRGDYLYLSDNDMYFTPGWLNQLLEVNKLNGVDVLGGWNHPFLKPKSDRTYYPMTSHVCLHDAVAGASQLMRWETWDKYGPLDAHAVGVGQSEDWKFCQDIIKDGGRVGSIYPRVLFNCGVTNSFSQTSPGAEAMIAELKEAKKQYPDLYWE